MTEYKHVRYLLTDSQKRSIAYAYNKKESVTLRLNKANIVSSREGDTLLLTQSEYSKLGDGKTHDITIPKSRIVKMGGFLPFLIPLLAGLASVAGIAGGAAGIAAGVKKSQAADAEKAAADAARATELAKQKLINSATGSGYKKKGKKKVRFARKGGCSGTPQFLLGK